MSSLLHSVMILAQTGVSRNVLVNVGIFAVLAGGAIFAICRSSNRT